MRITILGIGALSLLAAGATAQRGVRDPSVWEVLAKRYDTDKDGKLTKTEYTRGDEKFASWDTNGDGVISAEDFAADSGRRGGGRPRGDRPANRNRARGNRQPTPQMVNMRLATLLARPADKDRDGRVTVAEWKELIGRLDCDQNGVVTMDEMPDAANMRAPMFERIVSFIDTDRDGKAQLAEVAAVFGRLDADKSQELSGDELAPMRRPAAGAGPARRGRGQLEAGVPRPGDTAPDFELPLVDQPQAGGPEATLRLSSFRGKKPVALIFGSYT